MTEPEVLTLILDGQKSLGAKVETLGESVVRLETKVEILCAQRGEARQDHDDCRAEIESKFRQNEIDHQALGRRLEPIETLHQLQAGGTRGVGYLWKAIAGLVGLGYIILSSIAIAYHW